MAAKTKRGPQEFTVFQENTKFRGILKFENPLRVLGGFQGEISGDSALEIGPKAEIDAQITAAHLVVYGRVKGNVVASEKVELKHGASLIGNIKTPNLEIDDGVIFEGQCEMARAKAD